MDPAFGGPTTARGELATLTLQLVALGRPTAHERVRRVFGPLTVTLASMAAVLAVWDLSLLVLRAF